MLGPLDEDAKSLPNCYDAIFGMIKFHLLPRCDANCSLTSITSLFYMDVIVENCGDYWYFIKNGVSNSALYPVILGTMDGELDNNRITLDCFLEAVGSFSDAQLQFPDATSDTDINSPFTLDAGVVGECGLSSWTEWEAEKKMAEEHNERIRNFNGTATATATAPANITQNQNSNEPVIVMPYPSHRLLLLLLSSLTSILGQYIAEFLGRWTKANNSKIQDEEQALGTETSAQSKAMLVDQISFLDAAGRFGCFNAFVILFLGFTASIFGYSQENECVDEEQCKEVSE